jgi:hypothetical protein
MNSNTAIKIAAGSCAPTFRGMYNLVQGSSYTQGTANLEFDDNSIDAKATECYTHVHSENGYTKRIVKIDNARGMTAPELQAAYQMAGDTKDRAEDAIGKFLMGMKGGSLSQCTNITIVSRKDGSTTCLHTDVDTQLAQNSFEPTEFVIHADREHLLKYIHPSDVDRFLSFPTGTLIQLKDFLPEMISHVDTTVATLTSAISDAYPHLPDITFYIYKDNEDPVAIPRTDVFYHATPSAVKFSCPVTCNIYKPNIVGGPCRVIEHVKQTREFHGGVAHAGNYYEHTPCTKGQKYSEGMTVITHEEVEKISSNLLGTIDGLMIEVTDETYAAEQASMPDVNQKGFHFVRTNRKVSPALSLGRNIHTDNESHAHRPRQRMKVVFSPELDRPIGSTWNKTMRDGPLAQTVIGDALYRIFRQRGFAWSKQSCKEARARKIYAVAESPFDGNNSSDDASSTDDIEAPPAPKTFLNVIVPKSPQKTTPVTSPVAAAPAEPESIVEIPQASPELPLSPVPPAPPRRFDRTTAVEWESHLISLDELGEKELTLLTAIRAYLTAA